MKAAQALVIVSMLVTPVSAHASSENLLQNIDNFPTRAIGQISTWISGSKPVKSAPKVLGVQDLTNQPVIEQSTKIADLSTKLDSSGSILDHLYLNFQQVLGEAVLMGLKWDTLTVSDVTESTDNLNTILTDSTRSLDQLSRGWGWVELDTITPRINSIKTDLATVRSITTTSGMQPVAYNQLKEIAKELESLVSLIGDKSDLATKESLYSHYTQVREQTLQWDALSATLREMLVEGSDLELNKTEAQVWSANQIPNAKSFLSTSPKNRKLGLLAIIATNQALLAQNRGESVTFTWLEESPMKFRTLLTNPSPLARQEMVVNYYLPSELQEGDVVKVDPGLEVKPDAQKHQLRVSGQITVAAGDSRIVNVETKDVWQFDRTTLTTIYSATTSLVNSLANTPQFIRAVELKSQIDAQIAKIDLAQANLTTPEQRIVAHRQTVLALAKIKQNSAQIQDLATSGNSKSGFSLSHGEEMALVTGGVGLILAGLALLKSPAGRHTRGHKQQAARDFRVFSGGIANSDL